MTNNNDNEMLLDDGISQVIVKIIQDHGLDILNEKEKFLSLLKDHAPGKNREYYLIKVSLEEDIHLQIFNNFNEFDLIFQNQLQKVFTNKYLIQDEAVIWITNLWISVLNELDSFKNKLSMKNVIGEDFSPEGLIEELKTKNKLLESEIKELKELITKLELHLNDRENEVNKENIVLIKSK